MNFRPADTTADITVENTLKTLDFDKIEFIRVVKVFSGNEVWVCESRSI